MTVHRPIHTPKAPVKRSIPTRHAHPGFVDVAPRRVPDHSQRITEHAYFLDQMRRLRDRDRGEAIVYTTLRLPMTFGGDALLREGAAKGAAMAEAGGEITTIEIICTLTRWTFPDDSHALMFKLKFGAEVVPPPWCEFFPD